MNKFNPKDYKNYDIDWLYEDKNVPSNQKYVIMTHIEPNNDLIKIYEQN